MTACLGGGGGQLPNAVETIAPSPDASAPIQDSAPVGSVPGFDVSQNWGFTDNELALDFRTLELGKPKMLWWYTFEPGFFLIDGRQLTRCRAVFTLSGSKEAGFLTIANAERIWANFPDSPDTTCAMNSGQYTYRVNDDGMYFARDGQAEELFEQYEE